MAACPECKQMHPKGDACAGSLPRRLDRYELTACIGSGGFGSVYRARHVHTGQELAVKVVRRDRDPTAVARLLREARAMASLGHPNVVRVFDCGVSEGGEAFVAMELVAGCDLRELLDGGPISVARALPIALQILDALAAAHEHGIVHRDVKPSNVFVMTVRDTSGQLGDVVKLLDFGVSKVSRDLGRPVTMAGVALGTPGYMAPEQFRDAMTVDARADIYAVGATLFQMLAGRLPIVARSYEELVAKVWCERAPALVTVAPHVPPPLANVIDRALARDADARWGTALDFARALRDATLEVGAMEEASTLRTIGGPARAPQEKVRGRAWRVVAPVGVGTLLCVAGFAVWSWREPAGASRSDGSPSSAAEPLPIPVVDSAQAASPAPAWPTGLMPSASSFPDFADAPGVIIKTPELHGLRLGTMRALALRTAPALTGCATSRAVTLRVTIDVDASGHVTGRMGDSVDPLDFAAAQCVMDAFRDASPVEAGFGFATFEVSLAAR